jgi:PAS domain S-box-containing protein
MIGRNLGAQAQIRRCLDARQMNRGQFVSPVSQQRYIAACIQVPEFPLTVAVGIDYAEAMADWRMSSIWLVGQIATVMALIGWLAFRASRRYVTVDRAADDNRELLHAVIDTLPAIITVKDTDFRFKLVNGRFSEMFGLQPEDCVGKRLGDLLNNADAVARGAEADQTTLETRRPQPSVEWTYQPPGRAPVHYVAFRRPRLDENGRVREIIAVSVDVSSMRRAQERLAESERLLQTIVDAVPVLIMVKDREARYVMNNRAAIEYYALEPVRAYGRTTREIFELDPVTQLGDSDHRGSALEEVERTDNFVLSTGEAIPPYEVRRLDRQGRDRIHLTHKVPLTDDRGDIAGVVTVSVDVTELKASQRAALEAKEMAEFANRAKSEFLANMSHELRTPLNAVIGFGQMMEMQAFGPLGHERYRDYARHVVESAHHLLSLIGDILDVSSIDLGRVELSDEPVDLAAVARTCLMMLRDKVAAGGIMVETDSLNGLPGVRGDRRRLLQILTNLVGNAIKFTPPGGHVRIVGGLDADGCLRLSVADTGIGMDPKDIETALEPFKQVDSVFVKRYGGTGLGLPIARRLATLHGAAFSVTSALGAGTTVEIRFPASRVMAAPRPVLLNRA